MMIPDLEVQLLHLVDKVLGPDGLAYQNSTYAYNALQHDYARLAARGFARQSREEARASISALEAATGTGKTFGYLVPAIGYAVLTQERVVISTYTRHLQRQVLDSANVVGEWVRQITGILPRAALRVGAANYVSPSAIEMLQAQLAVEDEQQDAYDWLDGLLEWACLRDANNVPVHSGLLADYLEEQGLDTTPHGLRPGLLVLSSAAADTDYDAYHAANQRAAGADVVVINHALLVASVIRWGSLLIEYGQSLGVVVCDEADRLRDAAASMMQADFTFIHAMTNARSIERAFKPAGLDAGIEQVMATVQALRPGTGRTLTLTRDEPQTIAVQKAITSYLMTAQPVAIKLARLLRTGQQLPTGIKQEAVTEFMDTVHSLAELSQQLSAGDALAMISWSPVRAWPSLRLGQSHPARVLGRLWARLEHKHADAETMPAFNIARAVLFTSATLSVPGRDLPECFDEFFADIGVIRHPARGSNQPVHQVNLDLLSRFAPQRFGRLEFVVMDPNVPDPTNRETLATDEAWLAATADMIQLAHQSGGRTLVLATSFQDAAELARQLGAKGHRVLLHERATPLAVYLGTYRAQSDAILITPTGWEGLDLPGLIDQLVITRIPYGSLDATDMQLLRLSLHQQGIADDKAEGLVMGRMQGEARRRLAQGIGRPLRRADSRATIWFADPRMPLPQQLADSYDPVLMTAKVRQGNRKLRAAIPHRFQDAYDASQLFIPSVNGRAPLVRAVI